MNVELFILDELQELVFDLDKQEEWKEKVETLGLNGQLKLVDKDQTVIPFLKLSNEMRFILKILCPNKTDIKEFDAEPIPLEVLGVVELAIKEGWFKRITVWSDTKTDPFIIGEADYAEYYLIARWGKHLRSFDDLREEAYRRLKDIVEKFRDSLNPDSLWLKGIEVGDTYVAFPL